MAKNSIRDYSATNSANTDIQSIDISEGCSPAGINNAIREVMADLKDVSTGAVALESPSADSLSVTGDLTVDTNTLYVDSTNNRLGIATSSPTLALDVRGESVFGSGTDGVKLTYSAGNSTGVIDTGFTSTGLEFRTGNSFAAKIDSSGNVGIGHSTPQFGLTIAQGSSDSSRIGWEDAGNSKRASIICSTVGDALSFHTGTSDTERMRITSGGSLLLGGTSHEWSGSMKAQITGSKGLAVISTGGSSSEVLACWNKGDSGTRYQMWFSDSTAGGLRGSITTNGSSTSFNTTSDYRLKENVTADWDATTRLKQLNPVRFNFIADADTTVDGFLAHEVQDIVPEAISGTKDGMRDEEYEVSAATGDIYTPAVEATYDEDGVELTAAIDEVIHSTDVERPEELAEGQQWRETTAAVMGTRSVPDYQGIDQSKLVPLLVKTIQELEARITALEAN